MSEKVQTLVGYLITTKQKDGSLLPDWDGEIHPSTEVAQKEFEQAVEMLGPEAVEMLMVLRPCPDNCGYKAQAEKFEAALREIMAEPCIECDGPEMAGIALGIHPHNPRRPIDDFLGRPRVPVVGSLLKGEGLLDE